MRLTLRSKLMVIVAVDALALLALVVASDLIERRVDRELQSIQQHYVPRIGLKPRLERAFEHVGRSLQDAAAAGDEDLLEEAAANERALLAEIASAGATIAPADLTALHDATEAYFAAASKVSARLIAGEVGDDIDRAVEDMQAQQAQVAAQLDRATRFDERALAEAFASAAAAKRTGARFRLIVSLACVAAILGLSVWIGRGVVRSLNQLAAGFRRFGASEFDVPVPIASRDELGDVARQANQMAADLAAAGAATRRLTAEVLRASTYKSEFLASMSHELRTPLNAIIGFAELMHDGLVAPDSPEHQEFLAHILTSGRHLLQLINDVLDLSKVEAGKLELRPAPIVLTNLVDEVLGILRTTAANRKIEIVSQVDPAVDQLVLDPGRLKQVLYNYVSNAIKFTQVGGRVEIRATPDGPDQVRLEVEDNGVGISEADLAELFTEFRQLGEHARKAGGTGLGLALTRRLVEIQGGSVGVRSVLGRGSVFHAVLPRITEAG